MHVNLHMQNIFFQIITMARVNLPFVLKLPVLSNFVIFLSVGRHTVVMARTDKNTLSMGV